MKLYKPKTVDDLPQFVVTSIRRGETDDTGYKRFEFDGKFRNLMEPPAQHWFWLLYGDRDSICASIKSLGEDGDSVTLTCDEETEPEIIGRSLAYLSPYWQAFHVWMVSDPRWLWNRSELRGIDAIAEDYEAKDVSVVDGREIRVWTKMEPIGGRSGQSRHYPATDQTLPVRLGTRIVPAGWGHEHCQLCNSLIDAGEFGYADLSEHWLCDTCYGRYVVNHDLAFIDDL